MPLKPAYYFFAWCLTCLFSLALLLARRVLTKLGLADKYVGVEEATGEEYHVEAKEGRRPFKAFMDTGLARTMAFS